MSVPTADPSPGGPEPHAGHPPSRPHTPPPESDTSPPRPAAGLLRGPMSAVLRGPVPAILLGLLVFLPAIGHDFAYDDIPLIVENPRLARPTDLRAIWLSNWWEAPDASADLNARSDPLYRPLTLFTLALNYALGGLHPAGYHLVNVLLHAAACGLVWLLVRRLSRDTPLAALAALLFAVHPVHVEAVANVVGRAEVLATILLLAGLLTLLPPDGRPGLPRVLGATVLFAAALLAKETAISYPPVALLALYLTAAPPRPPLRWWLMRAAILLVPLAPYFAARHAALGGRLFRTTPAGVALNPLVLATPTERVTGALEVLGHYTRLVFLPDRLASDYGLAVIDPRAGFTPMAALGLAAAAALGVGVWAALRHRRRPPLAAGLTLMLLASYGLISNTVLLIGVSVAERLFYWPSVFALTLVALGTLHVWRTHCGPGGRLAGSARLLRVLAALLLVGLAARSTVRVLDWRTNFTLLAQDVRTVPRSVHVNKNYAAVLMQLAANMVAASDRDTLLAQAAEHLDTALRINPAYTDALALRARLALVQGDSDRAWLYAESVLQLDPFDSEARAVLAQLRGDTSARRIPALRADIATRPTDPELRRKLAAALLQSGQPRAARAELDELLRLAPDDVDAWRMLGEALTLLRDVPAARAAFERVLAHRPDDWTVHSNLAALLGASDPPAALRHAERARALQPGDLRTTVNLAEALAANRRRADAVRLYRQILAGLDEDDPFRNVVAARIAELER